MEYQSWFDTSFSGEEAGFGLSGQTVRDREKPVEFGKAMAWAYHPEERASIFSAQLSQVASRAVQEDLEKAQVGLEGEPALSISKMKGSLPHTHLRLETPTRTCCLSKEDLH